MEEIPRPEYPRPQFARPEWLNLNGRWRMRLDDHDVGLTQCWFGNAPFEREILVPFALESALSGIGDTSFHPCIWYQRMFVIPEAWGGRRIRLNFGAVDYRATVWVNGIVVAWHEGGHTPFSGDITSELRLGENLMTVRAEDPPTDRYIPRGKQYWEPTAAGIFYARTTGIWQTVWLEPVSSSHLDSVHITPDISGAVSFSVKIARPTSDQHVSVSVIKDGVIVASELSMADGPGALVKTHVADPRLWSPEHPHLYGVQLQLHSSGEIVDTVDAYLGFRSIEARKGAILLNGEPVRLKMVLDQGYWPQSNLTPPSDEAILADIRVTKDLGFNGIRKHQKVEDPRFLYWADHEGLLVAAEMANAYLFNEDAVARMTREWIEVIARDYNHPSIIIWTPVNESWGVPNLSDRRQQAHLKSLYYLTKSLDDTRLVIDNDGWEHTDVTDLFAIHDYTRTGEEFEQRYGKDGMPLSVSGKPYSAPGHTYNGSPILLWEFGGVGYVLPEDRSLAPENAWGYAGMELTSTAALERIRGLYIGISHCPQISGVCYTQLYDVEQEVNGLMTYDRRMKFDIAAIREINSLLR